MRPLSVLGLLLPFVALGLLAAFVLSGRAPVVEPGDIALALDAVRSTPDAGATRAVATFQAALASPPSFAGEEGETPAPAGTPVPSATPSPAATATATATPTPKRAATAMALRRQVNTAVAATLTAQPTATPQPATPPAANGLQLIRVVDGGGLVNLRAGPGLDYAVLMGVDSGEQVIVLGRNQGADWLHIRTASGALGWMAAMYVKTAQAVESYPVLTAD